MTNSTDLQERASTFSEYEVIARSHLEEEFVQKETRKARAGRRNGEGARGKRERREDSGRNGRSEKGGRESEGGQDHSHVAEGSDAKAMLRGRTDTQTDASFVSADIGIRPVRAAFH